jgi:hypothetical protein
LQRIAGQRKGFSCVDLSLEWQVLRRLCGPEDRIGRDIQSAADSTGDLAVRRIRFV